MQGNAQRKQTPESPQSRSRLAGRGFGMLWPGTDVLNHLRPLGSLGQLGKHTEAQAGRPRGPRGGGGLSYAFGLSAFLRHPHQANTKNNPEVQKFQLFPHCRK